MNEKFKKEINLLHTKISQIQEQILLKDNIICEIQQKAQEKELTLKEQLRLYEGVRMDRNNYSKALKQTQDEIAEIKKKLKIVDSLKCQLLVEFEAKVEELKSKGYLYDQKDKQYSNLNKVNENMIAKNNQRKQKIKNIVNELGKLQVIKTGLEEEIKSVSAKTTKIFNEREQLRI